MLLQGLPYKKGGVDYRTLFAPNNNIKLYDSKDTYNRIPFAEVIMCNIDCQEFLQNTSIPIKQDDFNITTQENTKSPISITTSQSNSIQPFTYEDSNITAKEIINKDNTSTLVIESNTNLLEYQGNTTDTLMSGISGVFASMATLAKQLDSHIKNNVRKFGVKGRIAYWIFQAEGASVSLAYNYGNNGKDLLKVEIV
ncbi:hypothetical protein HW245_07090 [Helicobacter cinaedi]|nr:hypothetical protein HW245_07090 [Helicobacter cinaedi]